MLTPQEQTLINRIRTLNIPMEVFDFLDIFEMGAKKYSANNWLEPDGKKANHEDMHMSMVRHWSKSYRYEGVDSESQKHHLLHLMCRASMRYVRDLRRLP